MPPLTPLRFRVPPSRCSRCTDVALSRRQISSSNSLRIVGPESPRYIQIPEPLQVPQKPLPPVKGILPIPRDIFPPSQRDKTSGKYFAVVTKEPKQRPSPHGVDVARIRYRASMAEMRRRNLQQGLTELKERRVRSTAEATARANAESLRRRALLNAPKREDERLTNSTVPREVLDLLKKRRTPTKQITSANLSNTVKHLKRQRQRRQVAIHSLYAHARDFIITEEQLDASLEKTFGTDEDPVMWGSSQTGWSIWHLGLPDSAGRLGDRNMSLAHRETDKQRRLRKIAEAFTGGKI